MWKEHMSTVRLRIFHEIAKAGSIRAASEVLGVAPSSVSRQVMVLEHEMGTALLERSTSGVKLTDAGKMVANYARSVVLGYDSLRSDLDDIRGRRRKLIRLALVESVLISGPISAITEFRRRFDTVFFQIEVMPAPKVIECVKRDECEIGITFCPRPDPGIVSVLKFAEPIRLVVKHEHPLGQRRSVSLTDLSDIPLALPARDLSVRQIFDEACATAPLMQKLASRSSIETSWPPRTLGGAAAGVHWLCPQFHCKSRNGVVHSLLYPPFSPSLTLPAIWRAGYEHRGILKMKRVGMICFHWPFDSRFVCLRRRPSHRISIHRDGAALVSLRRRTRRSEVIHES